MTHRGLYQCFSKRQSILIDIKVCLILWATHCASLRLLHFQGY